MRKTALVLILIALAGCSSQKPQEGIELAKECAPIDFTFSVGATEGAAGTSYTPLIFTYNGSKPCTLQGAPVAQPVSGEAAIGLTSKTNVGEAKAVTLKSGDKASVLFAVATAANYTPEECQVAESNGVNLMFNSPALSAYFSLPTYEVCTKLQSTLVSPIVAGVDG